MGNQRAPLCIQMASYGICIIGGCTLGVVLSGALTEMQVDNTRLPAKSGGLLNHSEDLVKPVGCLFTLPRWGYESHKHILLLLTLPLAPSLFFICAFMCSLICLYFFGCVCLSSQLVRESDR